MKTLLSQDPKFAAVLPQLALMSNFKMMAMLNTLAGNNSNAGWEAIKKQLKLVQDELKELSDGIDAKDIHELRDGIADVLVTIYGLAHRAGIDADADLLEVVLSNLTKFDPEGTSDIQRTVKKYLDIGVETVQLVSPNPVGEGELLVTKSAYDQNGTDGKNYPKGKWLKSANFEEPVFSPLPFEVRAKLEDLPVHWDLGPTAYGVFVENLPHRGGYIARAIENAEINGTDVNIGDFLFVPDPDQSRALQEPVQLLTVEELDAKAEALGEIPAVTAVVIGVDAAAEGASDQSATYLPVEQADTNAA